MIQIEIFYWIWKFLTIRKQNSITHANELILFYFGPNIMSHQSCSKLPTQPFELQPVFRKAQVQACPFLKLGLWHLQGPHELVSLLGQTGHWQALQGWTHGTTLEWHVLSPSSRATNCTYGQPRHAGLKHTPISYQHHKSSSNHIILYHKILSSPVLKLNESCLYRSLLIIEIEVRRCFAQINIKSQNYSIILDLIHCISSHQPNSPKENKNGLILDYNFKKVVK